MKAGVRARTRERLKTPIRSAEVSLPVTIGSIAACAVITGATLLTGTIISCSIYFRDKRKPTWPETSGTLAFVDLTDQSNQDENRSPWEVTAEYWYEYSVGGKTYYGLAYKSVQPTESQSTKADLERIREEIYRKFPLGSKTTIFFDPHSPNKAEAIHARTTLKSAQEKIVRNIKFTIFIAIIVLLFLCSLLLPG